jgi:hypothetical protein
MNLFNQWVLKRAEKLNKKKEAKEAQEKNEYLKRWERRKSLESQAKSILSDTLDSIAKKMENQEEHIKTGDVAILNKYGFKFDPYNGWDGGPNTYLGHCKPEDLSTPIIVDINSIIIDRSLADEKIDRWIDNLSDSELEIRIKEDRILTTYTAWVQNQRSEIFQKENFFLYKTAKFKAQFKEFNPRWGLCIQSFLEINSKEARQTKEIWLEEISLDFANKQIRENQKSIDEKIKTLSVKTNQLKSK